MEAPPPASHGLRLPAHLPSLDALRAVAVSLVFLQHLGDRFLPAFHRSLASLPSGLSRLATICMHHAHVGVDLFFVLSGFSLGYAELRAHERPSASRTLSAFCKRRLRRILPGYAVATLLVVFTHPGRLMLRETWVTLLGYAAVIQGYVPLPTGFIGASWSLTTELHAYALFPFLLGVLTRKKSSGGALRWPAVFAVCAFSWGLRWALSVYCARNSHALGQEAFGTYWAFEFTQHRFVLSRLDQFALGASASILLAPILRGKHEGRVALAWVLPLLGIGLAIFGFVLEGDGWQTPSYAFGYPVISLGVTLFVAGTVLRPVGPRREFAPAEPHQAGRRLAPAEPHQAGRRLAPAEPHQAGRRLARAVERIGAGSYGFFLNHQWVLGLVTAAALHLSPAFAAEGNILGALTIGGAAFALSALLGDLSRRFVEEPMMK